MQPTDLGTGAPNLEAASNTPAATPCTPEIQATDHPASALCSVSSRQTLAAPPDVDAEAAMLAKGVETLRHSADTLTSKMNVITEKLESFSQDEQHLQAEVAERAAETDRLQGENMKAQDSIKLSLSLTLNEIISARLAPECWSESLLKLAELRRRQDQIRVDSEEQKAAKAEMERKLYDALETLGEVWGGNWTIEGRQRVSERTCSRTDDSLCWAWMAPTLSSMSLHLPMNITSIPSSSTHPSSLFFDLFVSVTRLAQEIQVGWM